MEYDNFIDYIKEYVSTIFESGLKIRCSTTLLTKECDNLFDDVDSFFRKMEETYGEDIFKVFHSKSINRMMLGHIFDSNCKIYPDFKNIVKKKLEHILATNDITNVSHSNIEKNINNVAFILNVKWDKWALDRDYYGSSFMTSDEHLTLLKSNSYPQNSEQKRLIEECKRISWLDSEKSLLNLYSFRTFIELLIMANIGYADCSHVKKFISNVRDSNNVTRMNDCIELLVEHAIGSERLHRLLLAYVDRFEKNVIFKYILQNGIMAKEIHYALNSNTVDDPLISPLIVSDITLMNKNYMCISYRLKDAQGKKQMCDDMMNTAQDFIAMNSAARQQRRFIDFCDLDEYDTPNYYQRFILANYDDRRKKLVSYQEAGKFSHILLILPVNLTTLKLTPDDLVNFIPEM